MSLRQFLGLWRDGEPLFDDWERSLWRAFHEWEAGRCPGCGQPLTESLWDDKQSPAERAKWLATFVECRACEVLEITQGVQHQRDEQANERRRKEMGDSYIPIPTSHRHWRVRRDDQQGR